MNLRFFYKSIVLFILFSFNTALLLAQISQGGVPVSFDGIYSLSSRVDTRELASPDLNLIAEEDQANAILPFPGPERMAVSVPVNLGLHNSGTWETLPDGSRLWRLSLRAPGALALGAYYSDYFLPEGATLYLYNESFTQVIGAFTSFNNHESGLFASEFIQGDRISFEYHEPAGLSGQARITISELAYAYRFIEFDFDGISRGGSWPCMINVICPEGLGWEDQRQGVARMSIKIGWNYYWCSGSLINNTSNNRVPYFLSAEHCGEGATAGDMTQWIFYFNYQSSSCTINYASSSNSMTGCTLKSKDPLLSYDGADFLLVQLNNTPPSSYNVYYNGWNRTNTPGDHGVCIHHPAGDIKKISTYLNPMISSTWWNGTPSHWRVSWSPTVTGLSIMQGGSSGSPVFDEDKLIMGDLSGGYQSNSCTDPSPAWFGKVWYAWDQNGTTPATRLKDWLDPTNTGVLKQQGISSQVLPPVVDFEADTNIIQQGGAVQYTDLTTGNPATSWSWTFPGGLPPTSAEKNPIVYYNDYGVFDVTLTVVNPDGTDTETKTGYITVEQVLAPEADFSASALEVTEGDMIDFSDLSINNPIAWTWVFEGGEPSTSNVQNPDSIVYSIPGTYDVSLTAANNGGSDTEVKADLIVVNPGLAPTADFYANVTEINAGDSVNFFDLSIGNPTQWTWTFEGGSPAGSGMQNPEGIVYATEGVYNVQLRAKNSFGTNVMLKEDYIVVGPLSIKDQASAAGMVVYPNPGQGRFYVKPASTASWNLESLDLQVINSLGAVILTRSIHDSRSILVDLSGQPEGIYIFRLTSGEDMVQKKISLVR